MSSVWSEERKRQWMIIAAAVPITAFLVLDMTDDYRAGVSVTHIAIEVAFWTTGLTLVVYLVKRLSRALRSVGTLEKDLAKSVTEAERFKALSRRLQEVSEDVGRQFDQWQLSPAEKEVALLLLKGLSYQQIAASRNAAEGTVRQQALSVYRKAGLGGRSELAAFFLDKLIVVPADRGA